jgi:DNA-binding phage protein
MPLTTDFRETIRARAQRDEDFRQGLLLEAVDLMLSGDVETGKKIIRNYINATVGFQKLAKRTHRPEKSLMRMFSPKGNPSSQNMFGVLAELAKAEGVKLKAKSARALPRWRA